MRNTTPKTKKVFISGKRAKFANIGHIAIEVF